jgi:membrane-bound ClpP family serine protease
MRIGASLFLIAVGAILKWAVVDHVNDINLGVVGVILMIIGVVGLLFEIIMMTTRRRTDVIQHSRGVTYVTPNDPIERF